MSTIGYEEVAAAVDNKSPPILDVRTEDEFASGRIPGATNIPLSEVEFAFSMPEEKFRHTYGIAKPSKDSTFITACKVGGRATKMRDKLNEMGYSMVRAYTGSLTEWLQRGGNIEK